MAFPSAPYTDGQIVTDNGVNYVYSAAMDAFSRAAVPSAAGSTGPTGATGPAGAASTVAGPTGPTGSTGDSGSVDVATYVEYLIGDPKVLTADQVWVAAAPKSITNSTMGDFDLAEAMNFDITLSGTLSLPNPTYMKPGLDGMIILRQDATGGRTMSVGSWWKFAGGSKTLSTAANTIDVIAYKIVSPTLIVATLMKGFL